MIDELLTALDFAAERHKTQRRKDPAQTPYINHVIEVATILARHGVIDRTALLAAILHDTIEDTETTPAELAERFGPEVRDVVLEVTDDKSLSKGSGGACRWKTLRRSHAEASWARPAVPTAEPIPPVSSPRRNPGVESQLKCNT